MKVFILLHDEVTSLNRLWNQYRMLFGDRTHLALLKATADRFFGTYQRILLAHIILGIRRLADPPRENGRDNASIRYFVEKIDSKDFPELRNTLDSLLPELQELQKKENDLRLICNRLIAHLDRSAVTEGLKDVDWARVNEQIDDALGVSSRILDEARLFLYGGRCDYRNPPPREGDADAVLIYLKEGKAAADRQVKNYR